jgi:glucuronate isomerase
MSSELRRRLFAELDSLVLIDPHSHINPHAPASKNLADILGYHYFTELAHSAGMPKERIEEPGISPKEKVARLAEYLPRLENTIQYSWFIHLAQEFFDFRDERVTSKNWESLYDTAQKKLDQPDWEEKVLKQSRLESVFLTNDFDDPLEGFDTSRYIPCLRTDDLVFNLATPAVRERFAKATGRELGSIEDLDAGLDILFDRFKKRGARACAISLPPGFAPVPPDGVVRAVATEFSKLLTNSDAASTFGMATSTIVFWKLAERCAEFKLPFDLMIGVNRNVYPAGVHQGRDLFDSRVSLIQYRQLFNAFPSVTFPISVLASVTNQELVSYAWIFPNVAINGHWWYSNTPTYIESDLAARLEAVPWTKQIGYYSDMYKLEFGLPKFAMFKRILAKVLAERFVIERNWTEERAIALGKAVLRGNVETIFGEKK